MCIYQLHYIQSVHTLHGKEGRLNSTMPDLYPKTSYFEATKRLRLSWPRTISIIFVRPKNTAAHIFIVKLGYNVIKGTEQFVSLFTSVHLNEECNVVVNSEELVPLNIWTYSRVVA
jgi:hypothetical protein